jgi:hypothetical protein
MPLQCKSAQRCTYRIIATVVHLIHNCLNILLDAQGDTVWKPLKYITVIEIKAGEVT